MPQQLTTPTLQDDIRAVKEFVQASQRSNITTENSSCLDSIAIIIGCVTFFVAFVSPIWSLGGAAIVAGCILLNKQINKRTAPPELPPSVLHRILSSDEEQSFALLFQMYNLSLSSVREPVLTTLAAKIRNEPSSSRLIDGLTLREKLLNLSSEALEKATYRSSNQYTDFALAIVETLMRWNMVEALPTLLVNSNMSAPTGNAKRVRDAIREAIIHLSAQVDFGQKSNLPGMIAELQRLTHLQTSGTGDSSRWLWLKHALTYLLPTLTKADAELLPKKSRLRLYGWLRATNDYSQLVMGRSGSEFKQAILLALGNMEDTDALSAIADVAYMEAPTDHEQQTRALARKQRDLLTKIKEKQAVGSMLLRASDAPATPQDQLLRPAHPTVETVEAEQLLRPQNGG